MTIPAKITAQTSKENLPNDSDTLKEMVLTFSYEFYRIIYVAILTLLGKYCPLTILENKFREQYNPELTYPGSFVIYYIEKLVYFQPSFFLFLNNYPFSNS